MSNDIITPYPLWKRGIYRSRPRILVAPARQSQSGDDPFLVERAYDGIERRVLCFDDEKIQVDYTIDADAVFPEHEEARQTVYVVSGAVGLTGTRRFNIAARELLDNN